MKRLSSILIVILPCAAVALAAPSLHAQELIGLRIDGPAEVNENSVTPYRAFARFDDGREFEVTLFADWSVTPGQWAEINGFGDLTTFDVPGNQTETVGASFEYNQRVEQAELDVTIIDVTPAGNVLMFDGQNDFVRVADSEALTIVSDLTIEAWVRPADPMRQGTVLWRGDLRGGLDPYSMRFAGNGNLLFRIDDDRNNSAVVEADIRSYEWEVYHHVAGVFDDDQDLLMLYVDGQRLATETTQLSPMVNQEGMMLMIGALDNGNVAIRGEIDEVRLWNIARQQYEIQCDMHRVLRGDEEGLVGYWRFDEARGQIARDSSPYGNDGVLGVNANPEGDPSDPAWVLSEADITLPPNDPPVWGEPQLIPEVSSGRDHSVEISSNGLEMYLSSERDGFAEIDIYRSIRPSLHDPFSLPLRVNELNIPGFENHDRGPRLSDDGLRM